MSQVGMPTSSLFLSDLGGGVIRAHTELLQCAHCSWSSLSRAPHCSPSRTLTS